MVMRLIPDTTVSGVRCLVENISQENYDLFDTLLKRGEQADLFLKVPGLTEQQVYDSMTTTSGELYTETSINNRLRIVDVDLEEVDSPNLVYGHENRIVFKRTRDDLIEDAAPVHVPIATAGGYRGAGVKDPELIEIDNLLVSTFTVDQDQAHKVIKIPLNFISDAAVHLHWTKSQDTDQSGNKVKWQVSYTVYDGFSEAIDGAGTVVSFEDTYEDAGADVHVVYRTDNLPINSGIARGQYVAFKIEAITPSSNTLAEPALISMDFTYLGRINRNPFDVEAG
jgi:hypothetical protein